MLAYRHSGLDSEFRLSSTGKLPTFPAIQDGGSRAEAWDDRENSQCRHSGLDPESILSSTDELPTFLAVQGCGSRVGARDDREIFKPNKKEKK